eukprot:353206-Chlamydomonas_euryale.AAC.21
MGTKTHVADAPALRATSCTCAEQHRRATRVWRRAPWHMLPAGSAQCKRRGKQHVSQRHTGTAAAAAAVVACCPGSASYNDIQPRRKKRWFVHEQWGSVVRFGSVVGGREAGRKQGTPQLEARGGGRGGAPFAALAFLIACCIAQDPSPTSGDNADSAQAQANLYRIDSRYTHLALDLHRWVPRQHQHGVCLIL